MQQAGDDKIVVGCSACAARFRVPAGAVGKRGKCPKCGAEFRVQAPAAPAPEPAGGDDDDLLAGLASGTAVANRPAATRACPSCSGTIPASVGICPLCKKSVLGGDFGGGASAAVGAAKAAAGALSGVAALGGPMVLGCILSTAGAVVGGLIWGAVAYYGQAESAWIAWGVGGLAGVGMHAGLRRYDSTGGVLAAGIATLAIVCAKYAVFSLVVTQGVMSSLAIRDAGAVSPREELTHMAADQTMQPVPDSVPQHRWEKEYKRLHELAYKEVKPEIDTLSDAEVNEALAEAKAERAAALASLPKAEFFKAMFGLFDIIFVALAIGTAYRVGANGLGTGA